jgi:hypothetical protein
MGVLVSALNWIGTRIFNQGSERKATAREKTVPTPFEEAPPFRRSHPQARTVLRLRCHCRRLGLVKGVEHLVHAEGFVEDGAQALLAGLGVRYEQRIESDLNVSLLSRLEAAARAGECGAALGTLAGR